jgi:stage V sporulation protein AB
MLINNVFLIFVGYSAGIVIGTAVAAFVTLLQIIPRFVQISDHKECVKLYEWIFVFGVFTFTILYFFNITLNLNKYSSIFFGVIFGAFVGFFASALAEVLNVIPVLCKKLKLNDSVFYLIVSLILGKITGSIFYWLSLSKIR